MLAGSIAGGWRGRGKAFKFKQQNTEAGRRRLTLCQDEIIALDEVVEGLSGQLGDIGLGSDHGGHGAHQAESNTLMMHSEGL